NLKDLFALELCGFSGVLELRILQDLLTWSRRARVSRAPTNEKSGTVAAAWGANLPKTEYNSFDSGCQGKTEGKTERAGKKVAGPFKSLVVSDVRRRGC